MFYITIQLSHVVFSITFYSSSAGTYKYCCEKISPEVFTSYGVNLHCFTVFKAKLLFQMFYYFVN